MLKTKIATESKDKVMLIKGFMKRYNISQIEEVIEKIESELMQEAVEKLNFSDEDWCKDYKKNDLFNNQTPDITTARRSAGGKRKKINDYLPFDWSNKIAQDVYKSFNGCALTGDIDNIELDHFIPISWGHGGTYKGNMIPLRKDLNCSKDNQNPFEWVKNPSIRKKININKWNSTIQYLANLHGLSIEEYERYVYWCSDNRRIADNAIRFSSVITWRESNH